MSSFRDDAPPWSFFIPVTLAVIVGVLAADAIRYAIGTVFDGRAAPSQVEAASDEVPAAPERVAPAPEPELEAVPEPESPPAPRTDAGATDADAATATAGAAAIGPDAAQQDEPAASGLPGTDGVLELPDSMTARRDGEPAACVNGTVVNRVQGGWEQALENDAPVPCVVVNR